MMQVLGNQLAGQALDLLRSGDRALERNAEHDWALALNRFARIGPSA
jgi:hypothetical protein